VSKRNSKSAIKYRTLPEIRHGRHCVFLMHVHLVFVTKYRKDVLNSQMLDELKICFSDVCKDFEATLVEFEGEDDHVHLLLNYPPKHSVSKIVNSLKGVSSRILRAKYRKELKGKLWGNNLWSPSYFAGSCGGAPLEILKQYIEQQNRPD
jgi:putative transposase